MNRIFIVTLISVTFLMSTFSLIIKISVTGASQPPVDANTLTIGGTIMPSRADPTTWYADRDIPLIASVYEPLIDFARNTSEPDPRKQGLSGQFVPRLAKSLPVKEAVTLGLTNLTQLDPSNPSSTIWQDTSGKVYRINGWRDNNPDEALGSDDVIYMEQINTPFPPYNWVSGTKFAWQVETLIGAPTLTLTVKRTWYIFELRTGVKIHPWKFYNGTTAPSADLTTEDVEYNFERAMVQDRVWGPQWMLYKSILDVWTSDIWDINNVTELTDLGRLIDCAFQKNATHVKINVGIDFPEVAWYQILATWNYIAPEAFAIDHGCWPGTFFNASGYPYWIFWRRWPLPSRSPLDTPPTTVSPIDLTPFNWAGHAEPAPVLRGTGPYHQTGLGWNTETLQWRLDKFDEYWGGWSGNHINTIIYKSVPDWATRKAGFLNGEFDTITVPRTNIPELLQPAPPYDPLPGIVSYKDIHSCLMQNGEGLHFQFNVTIGSAYMPTIGGNNQSDFFSNVHARKAFAYALNFTQLIKDAWFGEAERLTTWHVAGLTPDYRDFSIVPYDLNTSMVKYHLQNANFNGLSLWDSGFHISLTYDAGNDQRRITCEMIKSVVENLNAERPGLPSFTVDVVSLPSYQDYWNQQISGKLPTFQISWIGDFADADNWAEPYMLTNGDFSYFQGYGNSTIDSIINLAVKTPDGPERRAMYYELQRIFIDDCPTLMLVQPYGRFWCRDWVQGWYYNPLGVFYSTYSDFYNMWKMRVGEVPNFHDVAVTDVQPSCNFAYTGENISIHIGVWNDGNFTENFDVTAYADMNITVLGDEITIETQSLSLPSKGFTTLTFEWNTTGISSGNYTISAFASNVPQEADTTNNLLVDGKIEIFPSIPCYDINITSPTHIELNPSIFNFDQNARSLLVSLGNMTIDSTGYEGFLRILGSANAAQTVHLHVKQPDQEFASYYLPKFGSIKVPLWLLFRPGAYSGTYELQLTVGGVHRLKITVNIVHMWVCRNGLYSLAGGTATFNWTVTGGSWIYLAAQPELPLGWSYTVSPSVGTLFETPHQVAVNITAAPDAREGDIGSVTLRAYKNETNILIWQYTFFSSVDNKPPTIEAMQPPTLTFNGDLLFNATVKDASGIESAQLYYSVNDSPWNNQTMLWDSGDTFNSTSYTLTIPHVPDNSIVKYYVVATDWLRNQTQGDIQTIIVKYDLGVTEVKTSKTAIGQGFTTQINVTIENKGTIPNTSLKIAIYANTTIIHIQTIPLLINGTATTLIFYWNTTNVPKGNCRIVAFVVPILGETDTTDNTFTDGTVKIGVPGDLNGDNLCDLLDLVKVAGKFGKVLGEPGYDPNYDFNDDNIIDLLDLVKVAIHFGETDP